MAVPFFRALVLTVLLSGLAFPAAAQDKKELRIVRVTPSGEDVSAERQIVFEFNRAVVPVGEMARKNEDLGITVSPPVKCDWRWLNTTSLSCNLGEKDALARATEYKIHIEPKIAAEDGAMISKPEDYSFITERPRIIDNGIVTWLKPGQPQLRVAFNQPVTKKSVEAHVYLQNGETRVGVKAEADKDDSRPAIPAHGDEGRDAWIITPVSEMPLNSQATLNQEAGLLSALGDLPGIKLDPVRTFYTFPEFAIRGVSCTSLDGEDVLVRPGVAQTDEEKCDPMRPISLSFTSPVLRSQVKDNLQFTPKLGSGAAGTPSPWGDENRDWSRLGDERYDQAADFRISFPYGLKAAQEFTLAVPGKKYTLWQRVVAFFTGKKLEPATVLTDEFGRTLPPVTLKFATDHRNPNYEMVYRDAVLEKGIDSEVPLYVNNLKTFTLDYQLLTGDSATEGKTDPVVLPDVLDKQFAVPLGIRDLLGGKTGAVFGYLSTDPVAPNKWDGANRLFAQVTPYQVYAKLGHFKSTVWVTDLKTGAVVPDAKVTIFSGALANLRAPEKPLASADTDEKGLAILPGLNTLDPDLKFNQSYKDEDERLFVRVDKDGDMALLPVSNDYEVQLWNVATDIYSYINAQFGHMKSWGMTAQGIYRAGDTMQYKIFVRDQDNNRFVAPPEGKYSLEITDPAGKSVYNEDIKLSTFGTFDGQYKIPETGAVGWYSFKLTAVLKGDGEEKTKEFYPLSVLVSDFTPAPFRVTTELNGDQFKPGDKLDITANALLHSGGPYGDAAIRSTITLKSSSVSSKNPKAADFTFDSFKDEVSSEDLQQKDDKLNDKGEWKTEFSLPEKSIVYGKLTVESAVRDERGKSIAAAAQAVYVGVDRLVGLKQTEWVYAAKKPATVKTIVIDDKGDPVANTPVSVLFEKQDVSTAKVKGAGNAYLNDNTVEWKEAGKCAVTSGDEGTDCTFTPDSAGTYRVTASIKDTKGRAHSSTQTLWVTGEDYVQWNEGRENALTIVPEKTEYKVGDTARYLVKNPYPDAQALVTVERYGVLDTFVQKLEGSAPVIEIPVKPDYVPGFYLSIVITSPRVDAPPPEMGQVDLGKPAFRVGYVQTTVNDPYKEMIVTAKADQEVYRPRDKVKVTLNAKPAHEGDTKEPIELAVAVLDESVFDLISSGLDAYDPYKGFYALDQLDVANYSLLTRLIGRQKFEKKGANPGGDGGVDAGMRNIFKFVSYWNPSVPVDADGNAAVEFDAPDNLTGWKILALAVTPTDRMGLGEAGFKVNRPTELRPVMPNQVREGDSFKAGFSVMNRTDKARSIKIRIDASGDLKDGKPASKEEMLQLEPYKRATVYLPLDAALLPVTRDKAQGTISFKVSAGDAEDSDGLEHTLPLLKSRTLQTGATYGTSTEAKTSENIAVPKDIYTDSGDISVTLSPSVITGIDGAFKYMRDYPYGCWEQKLSTAVMASYYTAMKSYLDEQTKWDEAVDLPQKTLALASSYQAPNGGMAYYVAKDEYADPYLSAYTALAFRWMKEAGYQVPENVDEALRDYLVKFLKNENAPGYYTKEMTATVRAVILSALRDTGDIDSSDVLRLRPAMKTMGLFGKAQFLVAAEKFPQTKDAAKETLDSILSSGVESGGKFSFNQKYDDGWTRVLATPLRDNCAVLSSLLTYDDSELVGDKPFKLVRMISQARGNRDHFENTQENIFCLKALSDYAKAYEKDAPSMQITASYGSDKMGDAAFASVKDKPVTLSRDIKDGDAGTKSVLSLDKQGDGRYYYATRLRYAAKDMPDAVNAGIDIHREYAVKQNGKWGLLKDGAAIKRGDLVRVDLFVSLPTARSFVVVDDPLPGGLETVNTDLATASKVDAAQAESDIAGGSLWLKFSDWREYNFSRWSFYHQELRHDSVRYYSDWLDPGNYHLSYMAQAVASGTFSAPPVKAEEMYDPDVYGLGVKGTLNVEDAP